MQIDFQARLAHRVFVAGHEWPLMADELMLADNSMLLIDKGAANYFASVSDSNVLPMRVNDFMHWKAICHCRKLGLGRYRLGPTFPEAPKSWPISKVAAFKGKFGGQSIAITQGSYFLRPEKYKATAEYLVGLVHEQTASPADS